MLFCLTFISSFLLASAAPADHLHEYRQLGILDRAEFSTDSASGGFQNSLFFSGAVLDGGDKTISSVTGNIVVPSPGPEHPTYATTWIGIDNALNNGATVAAGVSFAVSNFGSSYLVWYASQDDTLILADIPVTNGDTINFSLDVNGNSGVVMIQNINADALSRIEFPFDRPFRGGKARWGVKGFTDDIPEFGSVTFRNVTVNGPEHASDLPQLEKSTIFNMVRNNRTVALAWDDGISSVTVQRI